MAGAAGIMLFMVWVSNDFVAGFMVLASKELLQGNDTGNEERDLGKDHGFGSSKGNDCEEKRDESHDLKLGDGQERDQGLQLLLLATSCNEQRNKS